MKNAQILYKKIRNDLTGQEEEQVAAKDQGVRGQK